MDPKEIIHADPEIHGGTPVFVGTRVPLDALIEFLESGTIILGVVSIGIVGTTYVRTASVVKASEEKIEETSKVYEEARTKDKTTDSEAQLLSSIKTWAGVPAAAAPAAEPQPEH